MKQIGVKLSDEEYDKLMEMEGKTKSEKVRNLILDKDNNYFTEHFRLESIHNFNFQEQSFIAMGVLMTLLWGEDVPEKIIKNDIPKFNKGDITSLFRSVTGEASNWGIKYDGLLEFIGEGMLLYSADPLPAERIGYLRVLGQSLSRYFVP